MAAVSRTVYLASSIVRMSKPRAINRVFLQPLALFSDASEHKEMDKQPQKLCKGVNYLKDGQDPSLLPDSEYPDWLWQLADGKEAVTHKPDSLRYWRKINKKDRRQENETRKQQRK